jgi:hypothetical protein
MKIKSGRFCSGMPDWNWGLNDGTGDRAFTQHISFGEDLSEVPVIVLGISGLDCTVYPVRVDVDAKNVTIRGFEVEIRTWGDTHVWSCVGFWIAYTS